MSSTAKTDPDLLPASECIESEMDESPCRGGVRYRMSLSPSGTPFARCDGHWQARLEREAEMNERLGHWRSDVAPEWFDPTACGEVWSEEDY